GKKMSKSTGNVIDPLEIMGKYGTDAMRFTLTAFAAQGREIRLDEERIEGYRFFINKIWNAARFALMHVSDCDEAVREVVRQPQELSLIHRWILSRTSATISAVRAGLDGYHFNDVASANYQFIWHEFCDWYLEWIKADLFSKDETAKHQARGVLLVVLETILKLIHPITPFVTEEIWSVLPGKRSTLMLTAFPEEQEGWQCPEAEEQVALLMGIITGIRNIRSEADVHPSARIEAFVICNDEEKKALIEAYRAPIADMTRLSDLTVQIGGEKPADAATYIYNDIEIYVPLKGLVDVAAELEKLGREREKTEVKLKQVNGKLGNEKFLANAPEDVVAKEQEKKDALDARLATIAEAEERLRKMV
ncbi:MAG: class I tRNA ligase family protein, partial [Desulfoprunum sp.]|nr:class I tRNA ligase family protein [Desulfoprunum sp.]